MSWDWGPPSLQNHRGPLCEGMGASFVLGSLRGLPHGREGLPRCGMTEAPSAVARGASFTMRPPRPHSLGRGGLLRVWIVQAPLHGLGGLLSFGTTEGPVARARGPRSLWDR